MLRKIFIVFPIKHVVIHNRFLPHALFCCFLVLLLFTRALKSPAGLPALHCLQTHKKIMILAENALQSGRISEWKEPDEAVQAKKTLPYHLKQWFACQ